MRKKHIKNLSLLVISQIIIYIFLMSLNGCKSKKEFVFSEVDKIANKKWIKTINDTSKASGAFTDIANYLDSLFFFTDFFNHCIYKYDIAKSSFELISYAGRGPGQFISPYSIIINNDSLIINDKNDNRIQIINLKGQYLGKLDFKLFVTGHWMCRDQQGNIYFLNSGTPYDYFLTDQKGNKYCKVPKVFHSLPISFMNLNMFEYQGTIYFMNPYEMKVYSLNLFNKSINSIALKGIPNVFNWSPYYETIISMKTLNRLMKEDLKILPIKIYRMIYKDNLYFIILCNKENKKQAFYHIFNKSGKLQISFRSNNLLLIDFKDDVMKFLSINEKHQVNGLVAYRIKQEILNRLDPN